MFEEKEWSDGQRPGGVSFPSFSQRLCVLLQRRRPCWHPLQHASALTSATRPAFCFGCEIPPVQTFYKARGVISGCVKMSEHICWSKNVQTECVSRIINQLILGKQSSPQPEFICLVPADRLHQSSRVTVCSVYFFFFSLNIPEVQSKACKLCPLKHICCLCFMLHVCRVLSFIDIKLWGSMCGSIHRRQQVRGNSATWLLLHAS